MYKICRRSSRLQKPDRMNKFIGKSGFHFFQEEGSYNQKTITDRHWQLLVSFMPPVEGVIQVSTYH